MSQLGWPLFVKVLWGGGSSPIPNFDDYSKIGIFLEYRKLQVLRNLKLGFLIYLIAGLPSTDDLIL